MEAFRSDLFSFHRRQLTAKSHHLTRKIVLVTRLRLATRNKKLRILLKQGPATNRSFVTDQMRSRSGVQQLPNLVWVQTVRLGRKASIAGVVTLAPGCVASRTLLQLQFAVLQKEQDLVLRLSVREVSPKASAPVFSDEVIEAASDIGKLRFLDAHGKEIAARLQAGPLSLSSAAQVET